MLVLGIETSGERGSVALLRDDELVAEHRFPDGYRHARNIMLGVADVVSRAGIEKREIDGVAVTQGPGSFTGLRVGVTCAKTLAWVLGLRAVGVPTLDVLARNARPDGPATVCPLLDARRSFVYGAVFEWHDGRWHDTTGLLADTPDEVAERIPSGALIFGSGARAYPDVFACDRPDRPLTVGPDSMDEAQARHTARLGLRAFREGIDTDPMKLVARYYRRTEAEEKLATRLRAGTEPG